MYRMSLYDHVRLFKNTLLYLSNLSYSQFRGVAEDIWGNRSQHMTEKFWIEKKQNIWVFFICLDRTAVEELVDWIQRERMDVEE